MAPNQATMAREMVTPPVTATVTGMVMVRLVVVRPLGSWLCLPFCGEVVWLLKSKKSMTNRHRGMLPNIPRERHNGKIPT